MENTNVELSENELALVTNAEFILTKNRIIEKVYNLFGMLSEEYKMMEGVEVIPTEVLSISPKIYKGEQYKGLPYVMLDYPRFFTKDSVFAIRNLFWWGNFFSINLHLSGIYQRRFIEAILTTNKIEEDWLFDVGDDEWNHDLSENNIHFNSIIKTMALSEIQKRKYIKLAKKIPLNEWDKAHSFFITNYKEILSMLKH